jgi:hypothetical protein
MTDFVRILQAYAINMGWIYSYGRKSNLNLLAAKTVLENEKVYLLHEPSPRKPEKNATGTGIKSILFTGNFFLMVKSENDMPYFNEVNNDEARSKYVLYIEPLLELYMQMMRSFMCDDMEVLVFEAIDVVNIFDENRDGILITYQIRINQ